MLIIIYLLYPLVDGGISAGIIVAIVVAVIVTVAVIVITTVAVFIGVWRHCHQSKHGDNTSESK